MESFVSISNFKNPYGRPYVLYWFAVISFILSIILLFFGKRLLRLSLGIIGFISFSSITFWIWIILGGYVSSTTILIIMAIVGVIAAFIVSYFTKFGIYIISAASGIQFGYLLSENIYPYGIVLFIILSILFVLAGLILPYYFMDYMVIEITSFNGFLLFRSAINCVVFAIFAEHYWSIYYRSVTYWGILFGSIFIWFLGAYYQYYKYKDYPYLKNMESKQTLDEKC
jgi:hypothetical protein